MKRINELIVLLLLASVLVFGCVQNQPAFPAPVPSPGQIQSPPAAAGQKFSDSPYASVAFQIAPGPLSADAQTAIAGFAIDQNVQSDGTTLVMVTRMRDSQRQPITLQKGQSLYFIDTTLEDDSAPGRETSMGDDGLIVVDANGYIAQ